MTDGAHFESGEDFAKNGAELVSRYHTSNVLSYDFEYRKLSFAVRYIFSAPDSLIGFVQLRNEDRKPRAVLLDATNEYGHPEVGWWGTRGITARLTNEGLIFSKIWPYGDAFTLGASAPPHSNFVTLSRDAWIKWTSTADRPSTLAASGEFKPETMAIYAAQSYSLTVPAKGEANLVLVLARGVNESSASETLHAALHDAPELLQERLAEDTFYSSAPPLTGDWDEHWKHGWIYDLETLRMNIRPPVGIYKHHWDGMQIFTPRAVLGEAMLDFLALSYADVEMAKDVILGTFADAPGPNIPASREDGTVNMVCADGSEVARHPLGACHST